jgi:hypothetical protein
MDFKGFVNGVSFLTFYFLSMLLSFWACFTNEMFIKWVIGLIVSVWLINFFRQLFGFTRPEIEQIETELRNSALIQKMQKDIETLKKELAERKKQGN